jgi:hypothetical protein
MRQRKKGLVGAIGQELYVAPFKKLYYNCIVMTL